ncbi:MAG: hypothetical protein HRU14_05080 [Planctomycetes bacterium]|nr:hypothetical protein [Planctomycetota bacterium]
MARGGPELARSSLEPPSQQRGTGPRDTFIRASSQLIAPLRSSLLATLCALVCLAACGADAPASDPDWAALMAEARRASDVDARFALFTDLREQALAAAGRDRLARGAYLAVLEDLRRLEASRGSGVVADRLAEKRRNAARRYLVEDPGDGFVRGLVAFMMAREKRFDDAWRLLGAGATATDPTAEQERRLLDFAIAVAAMSRVRGDPEIEKPGLQAYATLLEALVVRSEAREVGPAYRLFLIARCAKAQLSAGRLEQASRFVGEWEKLDPSSLATIEVRQQIASARR